MKRHHLSHTIVRTSVEDYLLYCVTPRHISTHNRYHMFHSQVELCPCIFGRHCHALKDAGEHIKYAGIVVQQLSDTSVAFKLQKCALFTNITVYSCYIILLGQFKVDNQTVDAICKLKWPTIVTDLRSILGICNVLRRFVPSLARIGSPISRDLKKQHARTLGPLDEDDPSGFWYPEWKATITTDIVLTEAVWTLYLRPRYVSKNK